MIACASSPGRLLAAPFAVLGSIGVIGQSINIQRTLEGWGIRPLVFRAGKNKAPVGLIGEVTDEGIKNVQAILDDTHRAFRRHVAEARPILASRIHEIATGDVWLGYDAIEIGLVDRLITSDEYVLERIRDGAQVLKLVQMIKPKFPFTSPSTTTMSRIMSAVTSSKGVDQGSQSNSNSIMESLLIPILTDLRTILEKVKDILPGDFLSSMTT